MQNCCSFQHATILNERHTQRRRSRTILSREILRVLFNAQDESISLKLSRAISFEPSILLLTFLTFLCETVARIYRIFSGETSDSNRRTEPNVSSDHRSRNYPSYIEVKSSIRLPVVRFPRNRPDPFPSVYLSQPREMININ